jgi:hypothetical protein
MTPTDETPQEFSKRTGQPEYMADYNPELASALALLDNFARLVDEWKLRRQYMQRRDSAGRAT